MLLETTERRMRSEKRLKDQARVAKEELEHQVRVGGLMGAWPSGELPCSVSWLPHC